MQIETERLILRRFRSDDLDRYYEIHTHPEVSAALCIKDWGKPDAWRHIAMFEGHWPLCGFSMMAVDVKDTGKDAGRMIGRCGPWSPVGYPGVEIGWTIDPAFQGEGYATEAAAASRDFIFEKQPELQSVVHVIAPSNRPSQSVVEKLGGIRTDETMEHPIAGRLEIWRTARPTGEMARNV
ncbi:MAG: GNAT family N-acetyltransferase [Pseudomonadota bacterium]